MSGSEENIRGPDSSTIVSPISVQGARSLASSGDLLPAHAQIQEPEIDNGNGSDQHREPHDVDDFEGRKDQFGRIERIHYGQEHGRSQRPGTCR